RDVLPRFSAPPAPPTQLYPLSLHDALPISAGWWNRKPGQPFFSVFNFNDSHQSRTMTHAYSWYEEEVLGNLPTAEHIGDNDFERSEEHTSELQSRENLVCRLLLEKKNKQRH